MRILYDLAFIKTEDKPTGVSEGVSIKEQERTFRDSHLSCSIMSCFRENMGFRCLSDYITLTCTFYYHSLMGIVKIHLFCRETVKIKGYLSSGMEI